MLLTILLLILVYIVYKIYKYINRCNLKDDDILTYSCYKQYATDKLNDKIKVLKNNSTKIIDVNLKQVVTNNIQIIESILNMNESDFNVYIKNEPITYSQFKEKFFDLITLIDDANRIVEIKINNQKSESFSGFYNNIIKNSTELYMY